MPKKTIGSRSFGTFSGVFLPTFLSIIGVILFLRLGYIVGTAGMINSVLIILLAVSVTFATGLSLSSITTTIRIGAGGAYSIISKTLGLEVGGSVGIPLFLAQTLSVALYILGFTEAWVYIFPTSPRLLVAIITLLVLFLLTFINTKYAVKTQIGVFVLVLGALASILLGGHWVNTALQVPLFGSFQNTSFWLVFAVFFPAVTGLMAGIGMSGELSDPKRQIPKGIMTGLGITTIIYLVMIFWLGHVADPQSLINNSMIMTKYSLFAPLVLIGVLAAAFSSALTTLVAAPRVLMALSENSILPFSKFISKKSKRNEPRNAVFITVLFILIAILSGSLNLVAQVLTMFFLISYAMTNIVVFIEQQLGLVGFRPTFKIHKLVPLYGALGSIAVMFLINVIAGFVALGFLFFTYIYLVRKKLVPKEGDVRSGLFRTISEWAAKKSIKFPEATKHNWKPSVLLPLVTTETLLGIYRLVKPIVYPNGTLTVLGLEIEKDKKVPEIEKNSKVKWDLEELPHLIDKFGKEGIFTAYSTVETKDYTKGVCVSLEAIAGQIFHPNILLLPFKPKMLPKKSLESIFETSKKEGLGVVFFDRDDEIGLGSQEEINVWVPNEILKQTFYEKRDFDLSLLLAYKLCENWKGKLILWMNTEEKNEEKAKAYLKKLVYEGRLPPETECKVVIGNLKKSVKDAQKEDLHIIPVGGKELETIKEISKITGKSFLFVADSGKEDILA